MKRRHFLKLLGISTSATVLAACGVEKGTEKLIPLLVPPEDDYIPGLPVLYTSTCTECPANCGINVKTRSLHPVKLEGLQNHPVNSRGTLCLRGQSSLMRLYHPRRIRQPLLRQASGNFQQITWKEAYQKIDDFLQATSKSGKKNVYLAGRTTGSISALLNKFSAKKKVERLPDYEAFAHANLRKANQIVFGVNDVPGYRISQADYLVTVGADLVDTFVSPVNYAGQIKEAREKGRLGWAHIEPATSLTAVYADQTLRPHPGSEAMVLMFILQELLKQPAYARRLPGTLRGSMQTVTAENAAKASGLAVKELHKLVTRFMQARKPLLMAGGVCTEQEQGLEVAVLAALIQKAAGMAGSVIDFADTENYASVGDINDIRALMKRLDKEEIGAIFISRTNPVGTLPGNVCFSKSLTKAQLKVGMGDFMDETMKQCDVVLPLSHSLESWGDAQPRKSIRSVIQPTIKPVFNTMSEGDILLSLMGEASSGQTYQKWLFNNWKKEFGDAGVDEFIKTGYRSVAVPAVKLRIKSREVQKIVQSVSYKPRKSALYLIPSLRSFDGRSRHLELVQGIPDPLTTVSYGEWIALSKTTARKKGVRDSDQVKITVGDESRLLPVKVQAGLPENVYTIQRGMIEALPAVLDDRSGVASARFDGVTIEKTGAKVALPILAGSTDQQGRDIIPVSYSYGYLLKGQRPEDLDGSRTAGAGHGLRRKAEAEAKEAAEGGKKDSFYPEHKHKDYRWAMAIDLESCTGCSACVAACYVENNVAIASKEEHLRGREMAWIRLEPFVEKDESVNFLVMLCQQCENAPCESVCPVYATYHNPEGLNVQVYNRCVGVRYCANNCPYKVRRFNWYDHPREAPLNLMVNPDSFVRSKGIMEKCTFCIQRIRDAKDKAKDEGRKVRDGEVVPACAQTCPTQAIAFGNFMDEKSKVYKWSQSERTFRVLDELGVEPSVYYLKKELKQKEA